MPEIIYTDNLDVFGRRFVSPAVIDNFESMLAKLPLEDWEKEVLRDHYFLGKTYSEMAKELGYTSRSGARNLVSRILKKITPTAKRIFGQGSK